MTTNKFNDLKKLGMYLHIPFCLRKCFYCDFYSVAGCDEITYLKYTEALKKEIAFFGEKMGSRYFVDTIFIGGGTPSILPAKCIEEILNEVRKYFYISSDAEISMECNPATLTEEKLRIYRQAGLNRLSLGAQSFDDKILSSMGRVHRSSEIVKSYGLARKAGFDNINLDVMFGVPGHEMAQWKETVNTLLKLRPEHISFYSLELAEDTPFYDMFAAGKLVETAPELDREMYHWLLGEMKKAGYVHYEISNGALPGYECRHNLKYWNLDEYLGIGPSAHSYAGGYRFSQPADLGKYIEEAGCGCIDYYEKNELQDDITDFMFTALRKTGGIEMADFEGRFGMKLWDMYKNCKSQFDDFKSEGLVYDDGKTIGITEKGMDVASRIIEIFV